jgi:rhamnosyltransferase
MMMSDVNTESLHAYARRVCAVIVTYNPEPQLVNNLCALAAQVGWIVIVDNSSGAEGQQVLSEVARHERVTLLGNAENLGIAAALNIGVRFALERGYLWVATFDQDSTVQERFIEALLAAWNACQFKNVVAIVSPRYRDRYTGMISSYVAGEPDGVFGDVATTMTSGNLVRSEMFAIAGLFDESLFIDCVDHEFCLRLRSKGYRLIEARDAILVHSLGRMSVHTIAGKGFKVFNHNPLRRYYNARNRVILYRRYGSTFFGWLCRDMFNFCKEIVGIILFERDAGSKLCAIARGVAHGLSGRMGKCGDSL